MLFQNSKPFKGILAGLFILSFIFGISKSAQSAEHVVYKDPALYVIQKLKDHYKYRTKTETLKEAV
jgi:hypothetical protein